MTFDGEASSRFGTRIACGDIDGDGHDDIVIGAIPNETNLEYNNWGIAFYQEERKIVLVSFSGESSVYENIIEYMKENHEYIWNRYLFENKL